MLVEMCLINIFQMSLPWEKKKKLVLKNFCYLHSLYILILSSSFFLLLILLLYFSSLPELLCLFFFSCLSFYHPFPSLTLLIPFFIPSFHSLLTLSVVLFKFSPLTFLRLTCCSVFFSRYFLTPPPCF